jgi:4-amino-4-deoxy-L-arabinose transferase-like glycosyltransferase
MLQKIIKKRFLVLVLIVLIAGFLRFNQLGSNPSSLTWDEVAWGYNAYAIGIDGKDEFGKFLPYDYLLSFGDYKPPLYAYLAVIPVKIFGLTEFAVRFPSALFGTLAVLGTYFLTKEFLWAYAKKFKKQNEVECTALTAALFLAISPWHIMLSRAAFEANIAAFLIMTGVWLFLVAVQRKPYILVLSVLCFILSFYTFNSARVAAPLLFIALTLGFYRTLWQQKKSTILAFIVGLLFILPLIPFLISPEAKLRYQEVNIFSNPQIVETANQEIANDNSAAWSKIIHNRRVAYGREFLLHYFDHFNPSYLFLVGDENPKFSTHDVGELYLWDLPFLVLGIIFLIKRRVPHWWILPVWLILAIIPAATARETPHALRTESTLPTWQILVAFGFVTAVELIQRFRTVFISIATLLLIFFVTYFLHGYYTHYPKEYPKEWQGGYKEVVSYIDENKTKYDQFNISTSMERGYIYMLFYLKYDPQTFRKEAAIRGNDFGFVHIDRFNKFYFSDYPETIKTKSNNVLYIVTPEKVPATGKVIKDFYLRNGQKLFSAYTNNS